MTSGKRIYGLDILRASAILLVLLFHSHKYLSPYISKHYFNALPDGVSVFFVLSGFLIGRILIQTAEQTNFRFYDLIRFWKRRWLRTLPAYFVILIVLIIHRILVNSADPMTYYAQYFFFIQNIYSGDFYFFPESWSLAIEEWFYLLIPFVLYLCFRIGEIPKRNIIAAWIIVITIAVTLLRIGRVRIESIDNYQEWNIFLRKSVLSRMDSITFGFAAAWLSEYFQPVWEKMKSGWPAGLILLLLPTINSLLFGFNAFDLYVKLTVECIGTMLLIASLSTIASGKGVAYRFLTFTSLISYSIYLINYSPFTEWVVSRLPGLPDFLKLLLFYVWSFGAGWVLYRLVELPFMKMRKDAPVPLQQ